MGGDDALENLVVWYLEKGRLGSAPADIFIYETALDLNISPEEVRQWPREDLFWMKAVKDARPLVQMELARRAEEKSGKRDAAES